jgi:hypothetical protein
MKAAQATAAKMKGENGGGNVEMVKISVKKAMSAGEKNIEAGSGVIMA